MTLVPTLSRPLDTCDGLLINPQGRWGNPRSKIHMTHDALYRVLHTSNIEAYAGCLCFPTLMSANGQTMQNRDVWQVCARAARHCCACFNTHSRLQASEAEVDMRHGDMRHGMRHRSRLTNAEWNIQVLCSTSLAAGMCRTI